MECPKFLPPEKDMDENIQWMKSQCRGCNCMRGGRNHFLTWMPRGRGIQTGFCLLQFLFLSARTAVARQICTKSSLIICKTLTGKKRLSRNLREQNSIRIKLLRDEWWRGESGNNKFKSVHLQAGELMQESGREKLTGNLYNLQYTPSLRCLSPCGLLCPLLAQFWTSFQPLTHGPMSTLMCETWFF